MYSNDENAIEFYTGENTCTVSLTNRKYCNKIRKLYKEYENEFEYFHENKDGSICAKIPLNWMKISHPRSGREYTDDEKLVIAERLAQARERKKNNR